jgi:hypothetical protein
MTDRKTLLKWLLEKLSVTRKLDCNNSGQFSVAGFCGNGDEPLGPIKTEFPD